VSDVLIVGLQGLGVEVAKNVCLAGVKSVSLYDPAPVEVADLGTQVSHPFAYPLSLSRAAPTRLLVLSPRIRHWQAARPIDSATDFGAQPLRSCACCPGGSGRLDQGDPGPVSSEWSMLSQVCLGTEN
jgi:hypothetical protein